MKLRSKLFIAFSVMLLLVAGTTLSGWIAMTDMSRMGEQITHLNNSRAFLLQAQGYELRYLYFKDKSYATIVDERLSSAKEAMRTAQGFILAPAQKDRAAKALEGIDSFHNSFGTLVENVNKADELTAKMDDLNAEVSRLAAQTLSTLEKSILEEYSEADFKAFYLMNLADSSFYYTRLRIRFFIQTVTDDNAKRAMTQLAETRRLCVEAEKLLVHEEDKTTVKAFIQHLDNYSGYLTDLIERSTAVPKQLATVREQVNAVLTLFNDMCQAATVLMGNSQSRGSTINMTVLFCSILLGIAITIGLTRNITRQLGKDPNDLEGIATRVTMGDYAIDDGSRRIGVYGNILSMVSALKENIENAHKAIEQAKEESTKATQAMEHADEATKVATAQRDNILAAADKLEEVAHVVSSASAELSAQIEQSERGASQQAARVGETATAMEQMNSTVLEVARNAASANNGGNAMRDKALEGASVVDSAVQVVQKARTDALALKEDMNALSEQAQSIGQIMNVISDIADQTNLLALNAAIEAARAGDAGRGFAVVADEVRKLAEKTMQSTTDVGNAIRTIQSSAAKNMAQVDATVQNIETSTEQAEKSGQALREIVEMIDQAVSQISSIATASEEQSATSEEINHSIAEVNTIATETARAMHEAAQAVSDLAQQAQILTHLIEDMKQN